MALSCLSQCGTGVASELGKDTAHYLFGRLKSNAGYLIHYKKKVTSLQETFEDLGSIKNDIQRRTEAAEKNGEVVDDVVTSWLRKVSELEQTVNTMLAVVRENKRCFSGFCPDLISRYKLGKEATQKKLDAEKLQEKGNFASVSQLPPPPSIESMPAGDFMAFSSTIEAMDNVLKAMRDENQQLIGIYGMGGVGKTTLMEELGRQFSINKEFGTVIKVVVSQNPNIDQIRREIAEELGMRLFGEGESAARKLADRLKKETKIVIMMDDIWSRLELRVIGIPIGDEHRGCKILFTTRTLQACRLMESHASIIVDVLTREDSWTLFKSKVGDICSSPDIENVARKVADECGGLPLAIVVVGRALRGCNEKSVWESALMQLKRSIPDELLNVEEQLFKSLELSYNYIKNEEMKFLFLFCCLFREDYEITEDELTRYIVGEGFLKDVYSLDEARGKIHLLVHDLIASCLLLKTERERIVKMHDVVRDVAVYIASKGDDCFFVKAGLGMRYWPESKTLEMCKRISLMNNDLLELPDQPNCPKLLTLLLNFNPSLNSISNNFFRGMASLTVLDLSDTNIQSLPSSLALLTNLGSLRLDRCKKLTDIYLIGKLKKLKILGLQKCQVDILPEETGTLADLKLLDISYSTSLALPTTLMNRLSRLEELFMVGYDIKESLFVNIGYLERLAYLQMYVSDINYFSQDVEALDGWKNLKKFMIYNEFDWYSLATMYQKNLFLKNVNQAGNWTKILLAEAEDLILDNCNCDKGDFINVKKLRVVNCGTIENLLSTSQPQFSPNAFENLEHLNLANLESLKTICQGEIPSSSFKKMRVLEIIRCKNLVCIMPNNLLQRCHCTLQVVSVNSCNEVIEIFNSEGFTQGIVILPKLERLQLTSLQNLIRLFSGNLPNGSLQKLSRLQVSGSNKLQRLLPEITGAFVNLEELEVGSCASLKYLFSSSMAIELKNLEKLTVKKNYAMEVIIDSEDGVVLDKSLFPRLKVVVLVDLPMLERFYRGEITGGCFDWPLVEFVRLELCPNMKIIPIGSESAPKLKKIHLGDDDDVEWFKGLEWEDASVISRFEICKTGP
ncbi:probable disease resistance protein At1g61310 isoform X2 [Asparagus officinalis]|nr:probable disease resistance protein At1g61310 isoform X2 [Asparagus officinalis]XP_020273081.1 probable disease resistance protein At1g61310 isoform X2 [Asparagus officinalis]